MNGLNFGLRSNQFLQGQFSSNQLTKSISRALDDELNKVIQEINKKVPQKLQTIKSEIYGAYRQVVQNSFQNTFDSYYGNNYDINSLIDSLHFVTGKDLRPDIQYDINKFMFNSDLAKIQGKQFNQNTSKTNGIQRQISLFGRENRDVLIEELLEEAQEYEKMGDTNAMNETLDRLDYLESINGRPVNNMVRPETFVELDKVYQIAKDKAIEEFNKEFVSQLKPRILKKYGIQM